MMLKKTATSWAKNESDFCEIGPREGLQKRSQNRTEIFSTPCIKDSYGLAQFTLYTICTFAEQHLPNKNDAELHLPKSGLFELHLCRMT